MSGEIKTTKSLTVGKLRALLARLECHDNMPVVIESRGGDFYKHEAEGVLIDGYDQFVIVVDCPVERPLSAV